MTEELGRIEKPPLSSFGAGRKLYVVPLIYQGDEAPPEYAEKFDLYWQQVTEQISNLETKLGQVDRIYHESIASGGEEGLALLEKLNPSSSQIVSEKCHKGAPLEATEDRELAEECLDWERCLFTVFMSEKVAQKVSQFYLEASRKRYEHIAKRIEETLKEGETAILFIREGHSIQFPKDIQVFSVMPPALDQIHKWMRERSAAKEKE